MKTKGIALSVIIYVCCFGLVGNAAAFSQRGNTMIDAENLKSLQAAKMLYRLEGAYSEYKYIQVELKGTGEGLLRYEKYPKDSSESAEGEDTVRFIADEATVKRLVSLHNEVNFFSLEVNDLNKNRIQVADVGTTTLMFSNGEQERTLSYGYVEDNPVQDILDIYWQLFNQNISRK